MKPNVLIIIATDIIGGPGKGLFQFIQTADRDDFEYKLCNFKPRHRKNHRYDFYNYAKKVGIHVDFLQQDWIIDPLLVWRTVLEARKGRCNLIQTHGYKSNIIGFFMKLLFGFSWIGFAHGYTYDNKKMEVYKQLDVRVLRFADKVVAVSERMKALLKENGVRKENITVIRNAVDSEELNTTVAPDILRANFGIGENDRVIGVVGRLNPEKGHYVFLQAMSVVVKSFPGCKALIIGDGQERQRLERYCKEYRIDSQVRFLGHQLTIGNYYQLMDLVVIPSFSEGLPNVLLEAMILGIPVIATSVGGIPEVIDDSNGILIPPGNEKVMAKELLRILEDEKLRKRISSNAKRIAMTSFRPEARAKKIVQLYYEVLKNSAGQRFK